MRRELEARRIDADRLRRVDVLPDGGESLPESAAFHERRERDDRDRERHHRQVVEREVERARRHPEAARASGERDARGAHADDLTDADRRDREVGAAQPECRKADEDREGGRQSGPEGEREEGVHAAQREQHRRVGPDPEKGGVTERDLTGEAPQQIPRRREDDGEREAPNVVQRAAFEHERGGERESAERGPGDPGEGLHRTARRRARRVKSPGSP